MVSQLVVVMLVGDGGVVLFGSGISVHDDVIKGWSCIDGKVG